MTETERRENIRNFISSWTGKGQEDQDDKQFWLHLIKALFGIGVEEHRIDFQKRVKIDGSTKKIDAYILETNTLIEQKSLGVPLDKKLPQSGSIELTPFEQACRYNDNLPYDEKARWIVTSNFSEFWIYDMNKPGEEPIKILLSELLDKYTMFDFLLKKDVKEITEEVEVSVKAGNLVGKLYDALKKQYKDPDSEETLKSLNMLCVRLVFLLYAEDEVGVFNHKSLFHEYLNQDDFKTSRAAREAIIRLFEVLDQDPEKGERDKYLAENYPILAQFPYVNGDLFKDKNIEIPPFTEEIIHILLVDCSENFDWSKISPTIFGAVFESTLNLETRRSGGMHYTSIENIHKVIDPLFLDELKEEFQKIKSSTQKKAQKLKDFHEKLASLKFLDPACGSGNFLTETYMCLRRLENEVIKEEIVARKNKAVEGQMIMAFDEASPIRININQFYGIEINDFAVSVARAALWIAEAQMLKETMDIVHQQIDFLPLTTNASIIEANALRIDWNDVLPASECNYIMGNPPFVGQQLKSNSQVDDMTTVFGKGSSETKLDYVLCWYKIAIRYINNITHVAYVSTSSICQGESVPAFWHKFITEDNAVIDFAWTSFKWESEAINKAAVYCVVIGFSKDILQNNKYIFTEEESKKVNYINAYLMSAPNIWLKSRSSIKPKDLPKMTKGSEPTDGQNLFLDKEKKDNIINKYPVLNKYIKPFTGATEFLNNKPKCYSKFCFWFKNGNPSDYININEIRERLNNIKIIRRKSSASRINNMADFPYLFCQDRQPKSNYLIFPRHTTSKRRYIPIGFMDSEVIVGDACYVIGDANNYIFGVLNSNVHMCWTKTVCGRLGDGYRYSPLVYNNFPWPSPTEEQKNKIEKTAQAILDARDLYPDSSLADLYDPLTMPPELRKAHQENDKAVMQAYGFDIKNTSEADCVAKLMQMYQELTQSE